MEKSISSDSGIQKSLSKYLYFPIRRIALNTAYSDVEN